MGITPSLSWLVVLLAKDVVGHLYCQGTLLVCFQITVYQKDVFTFFSRAASSASQVSAYIIVLPSHGQDFAFFLV